MINCICTGKLYDSKSKLVGYKLKDVNGQETEMATGVLKNAIRTGQISVSNLELTESNRLKYTPIYKYYLCKLDKRDRPNIGDATVKYLKDTKYPYERFEITINNSGYITNSRGKTIIGNMIDGSHDSYVTPYKHDILCVDDGIKCEEIPLNPVNLLSGKYKYKRTFSYEWELKSRVERMYSNGTQYTFKVNINNDIALWFEGTAINFSTDLSWLDVYSIIICKR